MPWRACRPANADGLAVRIWLGVCTENLIRVDDVIESPRRLTSTAPASAIRRIFPTRTTTSRAGSMPARVRSSARLPPRRRPEARRCGPTSRPGYVPARTSANVTLDLRNLHRTDTTWLEAGNDIINADLSVEGSGSVRTRRLQSANGEHRQSPVRQQQSPDHGNGHPRPSRRRRLDRRDRRPERQVPGLHGVRRRLSRSGEGRRNGRLSHHDRRRPDRAAVPDGCL